MKKDLITTYNTENNPSNIPVCLTSDSISNVKKKILSNLTNFGNMNYVYVVNQRRVLKGVFSIKEIFAKDGGRLAEKIMKTDIITVTSSSRQQRVAALAIKHNIKSVPVVDDNMQFLGIVSSDSIMDILHQGHTEEMLLSVGIYEKDKFSDIITKSSSVVLAKLRLPWLIVGLFGGVLAAKIIIMFEGTLGSHFVLAAFIPLIIYMSNAISSQTQTLYIRNLAIDDPSQKNYLFREVVTGGIIGLILSSILFSISFVFLSGNVLISSILSISLFLTIITAMLIAMLITWSLFKLGRDPAIGSGPFSTMIADILSIIFYFIIISLLLPL